MEFLRGGKSLSLSLRSSVDQHSVGIATITNYPSCTPPLDRRAISHRVADLCLAYHEVDVLVVTVRLIAGGQREDEHWPRINSEDGGDDAQEEGEISR